MKKGQSIHTIGRRKTSVARLYLEPGEGKITVNSKPYDVYFGRETLRMVLRQPLELLQQADKYNVNINVTGGGPAGQAGASRHALARALVKVDEANRKALKGEGYLTRDSRMVERKKYGHHKARLYFSAFG